MRWHLGNLSVLLQLLLVASLGEVHQLALGPSSGIVETSGSIWLTGFLDMGARGAILVREIAELWMRVPGQGLVDQFALPISLLLPVDITISAGQDVTSVSQQDIETRLRLLLPLRHVHGVVRLVLVNNLGWLHLELRLLLRRHGSLFDPSIRRCLTFFK